jgi:phage gpG-like protein
MAQNVGVHINVIGAEKLATALKGKSKAIDRALDRAMSWSVLDVERRTKGKLSNDVLMVRTGTLRRSIHSVVFGAGTKIAGIVGTPIVYGKTHELGLTIAYPRRGSSTTFPKRSFLATSLDEAHDNIIRRFQQEIAKAVSL